MTKLIYSGSWPETLNEWNGETAVVMDESGAYSRHSHFVQALRRAAGEDCLVFSRKQTCYITKI